MADVPNGEQGCSSPLELFNSIAAQGELVRSLKARHAAKVGRFAGAPPCPQPPALCSVPLPLLCPHSAADSWPLGAL
uniref:Uncharacterized protein n=1 Tax=Sus scrofa TaxID=9823 RepID=A0A8D1IA36_PIG